MTLILTDQHIDKIPKKQTVLIGGCFDIIHPAHIEFIRKSKVLASAVILLLESDENIKKLKGENRPLNNQVTRAENLSKLGLLDYIILLQPTSSSEYYYNLVKSLKPAIIAVTKDDPYLQQKKEQAHLVGGEIVEVMERDIRYSTSDLINKQI